MENEERDRQAEKKQRRRKDAIQWRAKNKKNVYPE